MAHCNYFAFELEGKGAHASQPQVSRDPIVAGAHVVTALQTIVSRGLGFEGGAVVTVGQFHAGEVDNVIPRAARVSGTTRTFSDAVTERVLSRLEEIAAGVEPMFGVKAELEVKRGYPVLENDAECAAAVARVAEGVVGAEHVTDANLPMAGGEDFAYFTQAVPGAYFFLGAGRPGEDTPGCHHPDFDFEDRIIPLGMKMFLGLVADRLGH
jgi:amidohydrolase